MADKESKLNVGILLLLVLLALAFRKKEVAAAPPAPGIPPTLTAPQVKIVGIGWEGSPQTTSITKNPGELFTAVIDIENTGGVGDVSFKLGIGSKGITFDELSNAGSPWSRTLSCPSGTSKVYMSNLLLLSTARRQSAPYDAYVLVQGKTFYSYDCFTIPLGVAAVSVLSLSWL